MKKSYDLNLPYSEATQPFSITQILDPEKLFHLNPLWIIESFSLENNIFQTEIKHYVTNEQLTFSGNIIFEENDSVSLIFEKGDYGAITIKPRGDIYQADVTYSSPGFKEESEEERNTVMWLRAIQEYLRLYLKNTINRLFFRYIMNHVVLKMTPSQRKISLMLIRITIVEIAVIFLIIIGYVIFVL